MSDFAGIRHKTFVICIAITRQNLKISERTRFAENFGAIATDKKHVPDSYDVACTVNTM